MKALSVSIKTLLLLTICMLADFASAQPVFTPSKSTKYNMQIDVRKNHLSGMLIARPINNAMRTVLASYFGLTIFDYTLTKDSLKVNNSISVLQKEKIKRLIYNDFSVVFIDENLAKLKKQTTTMRKRKRGHFLGKSTIAINTDTNNNVKSVTIKHPFIKMQLEPIIEK